MKEERKLSPRDLQSLKFLVWAPVLFGPVITGLFWLFGGGSGVDTPAIARNGFNNTMPKVPPHDTGELTKMRSYEKAAADSAEAAEKERAQVIYAKRILGRPDSLVQVSDLKRKELEKLITTREGPHRRGAASMHTPEHDYVTGREHGNLSQAENPDIARLERIMGLLKRNRGEEEDPAIRQLGEVMDKVLRVKYPGHTADTSYRDMLSVSQPPPAPSISMLGGEAAIGKLSKTGFYGLESNGGVEISDLGLASAIVTDSRQVAKGSPISMQLLTDIRIGSVTIPKGEPIYGVAGNPGGERLPITISTVLYNRQPFPVALQVLGSDGLSGLPIPGSFSRQALRESVSQGIGTIEPTNLDPSRGGQAANAGIQVARSLASRKVRAETARVQAGVVVFLQDIKH